MKGLIPVTERFLRKNSASILTYLSLAGLTGTAIMAVKATPKAIKLIENEKQDRVTVQETEGIINPFTKMDCIKTAWACYIPTIALGVATATCIVGANVLNKKKQAALVSAYAMLNESFKKYRKGATEVYGEDADTKISAQVAKDVWISPDGYEIYDPCTDDSEKVLFYDLFSNRYFRSTMAAVINAQYHVNRNLSLRGDVSINEFYSFVGLDPIGNGDTFGWSLDQIIDEGVMWLDFENRLTKLEDGMECYTISAMIDTVVFD